MEGPSPGLIWAGAMRNIHSMINHVEDLGGVEELAARWRPETRDIFIADVDLLIRALENWNRRLATADCSRLPTGARPRIGDTP